MEAFRYFGESKNAIYMKCAVRMCLVNDESTQCQYCGETAAGRKRRDSKEVDGEEILYVKSPVFYIIPKGMYYMHSFNNNCK